MPILVQTWISGNERFQYARMMSPRKAKNHAGSRKLLEDFRTISHRVMAYAHRGTPRIDFLREVSRIFIEYVECDALELRTQGTNKWYFCEAKREDEITFDIKIFSDTSEGYTANLSADGVPDFERLLKDIIAGRIGSSTPSFTKYGSLWIGDTEKPVTIKRINRHGESALELSLGNNYRSLLVIPFNIDEVNKGFLILKSKHKDFFTENDIEFYQDIALILGVAIAVRRTQVALRERIKELTCLYGIARLVERPDISLDEIMQGIVELIPPAWLYPKITSGRITLDDRVYTTSRFRDGPQKLSAPIIAKGQNRGTVEVIYAEEMRELDEGPFLKEERSLINAIAREVAHIIEHKQAEEEKEKLQDQLRHADRLATLGQLAAGVAHELNEPLGNILGFAQLAQKSTDLSEQMAGDLQKIINASLHAREIIRKLMVFARQAPSKKTYVNLNKIVEEGLYFFEARCAKAGIELNRMLTPDLPEISADSIQAMPSGGKLIVQTLASDTSVSLIVEDTGTGMSPEVMQQIFLPFFTTKDVDEGTGLGLAVVHGIVTSHRGTIDVKSEIGSGTRFEIQFPLPTPQDGEEMK